MARQKFSDVTLMATCRRVAAGGKYKGSVKEQLCWLSPGAGSGMRVVRLGSGDIAGVAGEIGARVSGAEAGVVVGA